MKCKEIQELLKTDYLDAELNSEESNLIAEHLAECPDCKKLEEALANQRRLFQKAGRMQVPEEVWINIREKIITERLSEEDKAGEGILARLKAAIRRPRVAFSLVGALTAVIFVLALTWNSIYQSRTPVQAEDEEIIPGYNLNGEGANYLSDLGTNIEEYFL